MEGEYRGGSEKIIGDRLAMHERWDKNTDEAVSWFEAEGTMRFGYRCAGIISALSERFLDKVEEGELYTILLDDEKPLKEAYQTLVNGMERSFSSPHHDGPDVE